MAPMFVEEAELRRAHQAGTLLDESACCDAGHAADIASSDFGAHSIAWSSGRWRQFSEPEAGGVVLPLTELVASAEPQQTTREWFADLRRELLEIVERSPAVDGEDVEVVLAEGGDDADLVNVGRILARCFDATMVLWPAGGPAA